MPEPSIPLAVLGSLLFSLIGPIGIIPAFVAATAGADRPLKRRIALTATATAALAFAVAVFVGAPAMAAAGTSPSSLILAAGLILTFTALRSIFGGGHAPAAGALPPKPSAGLGISPIAVPGIVTPVGIAVLIIFASYFPGERLAILAVVAAILAADLLAMLAADRFMRHVGVSPLVVLGAIFGVLQAAMGIQFVVNGLMRSPLMQ